MFCGSADGNFIPPYIIMKGTQKWSDWLCGAPEGSRLNVSKSGWIENSVFDDWFENHFLPNVACKPGKKLLIGDNMSAHVSLKSLKLAEQNNVQFVFLPANSTHLLQPLDVAYFSSLKSNWRKALATWRNTSNGKKVVALPKAIFSQLLKTTLDMGQTTCSLNLIKGFNCSGIFPVDRDVSLKKLPLYATPSAELNESIGVEFKHYLENIRHNELQHVSRARKYCLPVEPGKSVSVEEVEAFYKNKEEEEKKKKERMKTRGVRTRGGIRRTPGALRTLGGKRSVTPPLESGDEEIMLD